MDRIVPDPRCRGGTASVPLVAIHVRAPPGEQPRARPDTSGSAGARSGSARAEREAADGRFQESVGRLGPIPSTRFRAETQSTGNRFASVAREHWPGRLAQIRQALEMEMRQQNWAAAQRIVDSARQGYPDT